jgi:hypothetical protein
MSPYSTTVLLALPLPSSDFKLFSLFALFFSWCQQWLNLNQVIVGLSIDYSTTVLGPLCFAPLCLHPCACTPVLAPLCLHRSACTALLAPLCLHRCACTAVLAPLCLHRCACTAVLAPLCLDHCACTTGQRFQEFFYLFAIYVPNPSNAWNKPTF